MKQMLGIEADVDDIFGIPDKSMDDYHEEASEFAIYDGSLYPLLGMLGEGGEAANKLQKMMRDRGMPAGHTFEAFDEYLTEEERADLAYECGDILWFLTMFIDELGYSLSEVATMNIEKLKDRSNRGVLQGSGDHR
jgi:NTP pyrophosphatase (non-canonical NTP hydrolase)